MQILFAARKSGRRKETFNNLRVERTCALCIQIFFGNFYPVFFCERNEVFRERRAQF